jgi:Ca-activated chloride channel family protein
MPTELHFQHPEWLLALPLLLGLAWLLAGAGGGDTPWRRVVDRHLLSWLLVESGPARSTLPLWLLGIAWLTAVIALADPVWEKRPQPTFRSREARVIVLDLSRSMNTPDLKPSRLERARFKIADILRAYPEGQTGLVAFAGDAFTVSPLTDDVDTIDSLLNALSPSIMPVQGSRADLGLEQAGKLLQQAGIRQGRILLIADGFSNNRALEVARKLREQGRPISVLGVGIREGAPLPREGGGFVTDQDGTIVVPRLPEEALRELARIGGGSYSGLRVDDSDIRTLLDENRSVSLTTETERSDFDSDQWSSTGPYLILLLLPLAALAFRRGWLLGALVLAGTLSLGEPSPALAFDWQDLWLRRDQQATQALQAGDPERAAQLAPTGQLRGSAQYRAGDYAGALESFGHDEGANAAYNRGNALARLARLEEALEAYDEALQAQPGMEDAVYNRAKVEELLEKQQQQEQQKQSQDRQEQQDSQGQKGQEQQQDSQSRQGQEQQQSSQGQQGQEQQQSSQGQQGQEQQQTSQGQQGRGQQEQGQQSDREASSAEQEGNNAQEAPPSQSTQEQEAEQGQSQAEPASPSPSEQEPGDERLHPAAADSEQPSPEEAQEALRQAREQAEAAEEQSPETQQEAPGVSAAQDRESAEDAEQRQALSQWLRRIPDDPGGLLRRKFLYQYQRLGVDQDGNHVWPGDEREPW